MKLLQKLRAVFRRKHLDAEMAAEMREHLERRVEANIAAGMSADEARFAARRSFGGVEQLKEIAREERGWAWAEQLVQDGRYAARQLMRAKGFTTVVVLTLALGIGGMTAIYSVVDTLLFNPVPGTDAGRLVLIGEHIYLGRETLPTESGMSPTVLEAFGGDSEVFSDLAWADINSSFEKRGDDFISSIRGCLVSPNFFSLVGAQPILGRTFAKAEAVPLSADTRLPDRDAPIVLSYVGWQSLFAGDREVLGRTMDLSGRRYTVVGVMPEWFQFPSTVIQFWVPTEPLRLPPNRASVGNMRVIVRLKPGVALAQMQAMLDAVAHRLSADAALSWRWKRTVAPTGLTLWARPLAETLRGRNFGGGAEEVGRALYGLMAAIGFVLLIVCANVANLLLARTERRQQELAIRMALGAGRARLTRQLLTESLLLAGLGGAGGLLVTAWGMKLLIALNTMPRLRPIEVDGSALGIALAVSVAAALTFGVVPAWRGARPPLNATLMQGGAATTASPGGRRYRGALVIVQVALAVVLVTGAGLMIQSVVRLLQVNPGYDPENLIIVSVSAPNRAMRFGEGLTARNQFYEGVRERFLGLPGVKAVGTWKNGGFKEPISLEGRVDKIDVYRGATGIGDDDYFRVARVPLLAGRYLEPRDVGEGVGTVVINETMAAQCWPGEPAVGKKFRATSYASGKAVETWCEVVGVVADVRTYKYDEERRAVFFRPLQEADLTGAPVWTVVRAAIDPTRVMPSLRQELKAIETDLRTPMLELAGTTLFETTQPRRTFRNYLAVFAGVGMLLSALGIYGVLAYSVALRTREIGIRIAIGAERRHVMAMVIGEGTRLIGLGVVSGLLAAFWMTELLQKQLFGVSPHEPAVLATVVLVLSGVGLFACWLPARRAARVDPMVALRAE